MPPPDLSPLAQTALAALWARATEQQHPHPLLHDPAAADWLDQLTQRGFDPTPFARARATQAAACARAALLDRWVQAWLAQHPAGVIVELGAGFSTRPARLGLAPHQHRVVDRPEVLAHRRVLESPETDFPHHVPATLGQAPWPSAALPGPVCLVAEGLFMYLHPTALHRLLAELARAHPDVPLFFDAYAPLTRLFITFHDSLRHTRAKLRSTWRGSPHVSVAESIHTPQLPGLAPRLSRLYRLPGARRLYKVHRAALVPV